MSAFALKIGADFLTASGLPVRVIQVADGLVELQSLATDNRLWVPASYPLEVSRHMIPVVARRQQPHAWINIDRPGINHAPRPLAPLIDSLLLSGGKTMRGILREVRRKASASCKGKDLAANVRARLYWFKRKGYCLEKSAQHQLRLAPPVAGASQ